MKKIFSLSLLVAALFSSNAFATHAYRGENCKSLTHKLDYLGNYPIGGSYGMSVIGTEADNTKALPLFDKSETPNTLEDADVIFSEVSSKIIEQAQSSKDCDFDYEEWKSEKIIEIKLILSEGVKNLGLNQGDKITFICEESTAYPNRSNCH